MLARFCGSQAWKEDPWRVELYNRLLAQHAREKGAAHSPALRTEGLPHDDALSLAGRVGAKADNANASNRESRYSHSILRRVLLEREL